MIILYIYILCVWFLVYTVYTSLQKIIHMFMTVYVSNWAEYMVNQATGSAGHPALLSPPTAIGHALVHQPAVFHKKAMATVDSTQIFFRLKNCDRKETRRKKNTREFWKISVPIRCLSLSISLSISLSLSPSPVSRSIRCSRSYCLQIPALNFPLHKGYPFHNLAAPLSIVPQVFHGKLP